MSDFHKAGFAYALATEGWISCPNCEKTIGEEDWLPYDEIKDDYPYIDGGFECSNCGERIERSAV